MSTADDQQALATPYDRSCRIEQLIERWALREPERVVAVSDARAMTFAHLNSLSNRLAHQLIALGCGPGDYVIVQLERDPIALVSILAVLKAGAAFIPFELDEPVARLEQIMALEEVRAAITDASHFLPFCRAGLNTLTVDLESLEHADTPNSRPHVTVSPSDPAYGISTSGSSGTPKTVCVAHSPLVNLIEWVGKQGLTPEDRGLWVSPISFDLSIFDLLGLPALGASVRMVSRSNRKDPSACADILASEPITFWNSAPALLATLIPFLEGKRPSGWEKHLRMAFLSGDWIPLHLPDRVRSVFPRLMVMSLGGATEATVWSNYYPTGEVDPDWKSIPYGRPIQNARYYILDTGLTPCASNVVGELYIGGECLAQGYLGDESLTESRFAPDPFIGKPGMKMYRTGDLATRWENGTIELIGRIDRQVNVSGYRVELGEVEAALRECGVRRPLAVAIAGMSSTQRIVAAGIPQDSRTTMASIRERLATLLPAHMVPAEVKLVESLPLTANGKVDQEAVRALFGTPNSPEPSRGDQLGTESAASGRSDRSSASDEIFRFLAQQVETSFGKTIPTGDAIKQLADLGLNSLEFAFLSARLYEEFGLKFSPVDFFSFNDLESASAHIATLLSDGVAGESGPERQPIPHADTKEEAGGTAVVGMSCRFPGAKNPEEFWRLLIDGVSRVGPPSPERAKLMHGGEGSEVVGAFLDDVDAFDAECFGIHPREAKLMDPRQRLLLEAVWTAIEHSGEDPLSLRGSRTGVFIGSTGDDFARMSQGRPNHIEEYSLTGFAPSILANRISFKLDLKGPSEVIDTACSSSLVALHRAVTALQGGECDGAIVGGISLMLDATTHAALGRVGMLSAEGISKTFDAAANGYGRGEGVGVIYLKSMAKAQMDGNTIHGSILGTAVNHNGRGASLTAPVSQSQADVIVTAHRKAGIDPESVGMIEAHGTGTPLGDPIEIGGIQEAFRVLQDDKGTKGAAKKCALTALKPNIGHLEGAAGIAGVLKALLCVNKGMIPGLVHFHQQNPHIDLSEDALFIATNNTAWPVSKDRSGTPRRAGVSSFGFGGTNAHVVLQSGNNPFARGRDNSPSSNWESHELVISAKSASSLADYVDAYIAFVADLLRDGVSEDCLRDIAWTSRNGRPRFGFTAVFAVRSLEALLSALKAWASEHRSAAKSANTRSEHSEHSAPGPSKLGPEDRQTTRSCRVPLPTYPFRKTRFWPAFLEPNSSSPLTAFPESANLDLEAHHPLIEAHTIDGRPLIPAALLLHQVQHWHGKKSGVTPMTLRRVGFLANVRSKQLPPSLQLTCEQGDGIWKLAIKLSSERSTLLRAELVDGSEEPSEPLSKTGLNGMGEEGTVLSAEQCYRLLAESGVRLEGALRTIYRLSWSEKRGEAEVLNPPSGSAGSSQVGILDGAFQCALLWQLLTDKLASVPIPFSIDSVRWHHPTPTQARVVVTTSPRHRVIPGHARVTDISVFDQQGRRCLTVEGFGAISMRKAAKPSPSVQYFEKQFRAIETIRPAGDGDRAEVRPPMALFRGAESGAWLDARHLGALEVPWASSGMEEKLADIASELGGLPGVFVYELDLNQHADSVLPVTELVQALLRRGSNTPTKILAVAKTKAQSPQRADETSCALAAFARSVQIEDPNLVLSVVQFLNSTETPREMGRYLGKVVALARSPSYLRVDCATGQVQRETVSPVALTAGGAQHHSFRQNGTYLISGGLGGVGRILARYLTRTYGANVMLCGREHRDETIRPLVNEIRSGGYQVNYLPCDVSDPQQAESFVHASREHFGRIDGVLHCAGLQKSSLFAYAKRSDLLEVIRPKVQGAIHLDALTRSDELGVFLLCSSLVATTGAAGQCAYALANGWAEGFARWRNELVRNGRRTGTTCAIGWGPWKNGGMRIPERREAKLKERFGLFPLSDGFGAQAMEVALSHGASNLIVSSGDRIRLGAWLTGAETDGRIPRPWQPGSRPGLRRQGVEAAPPNGK